jgi:hypothetical protein
VFDGCIPEVKIRQAMCCIPREETFSFGAMLLQARGYIHCVPEETKVWKLIANNTGNNCSAMQAHLKGYTETCGQLMHSHCQSRQRSQLLCEAHRSLSGEDVAC